MSNRAAMLAALPPIVAALAVPVPVAAMRDRRAARDALVAQQNLSCRCPAARGAERAPVASCHHQAQVGPSQILLYQSLAHRQQQFH